MAMTYSRDLWRSMKDKEYSALGWQLHQELSRIVEPPYLSTSHGTASEPNGGAPYPSGELDLDKDVLYFHVKVTGGLENMEKLYHRPNRIDFWGGIPVRYSSSTKRRQVTCTQGSSINEVRWDNRLTVGFIDAIGQVPITSHGLVGKRVKFYHQNGNIAVRSFADNPTTDYALGVFEGPFIPTTRITSSVVPKVGDVLHVHGTLQSQANRAVVHRICDNGTIDALIFPPGSSDAGDCGAAYSAPKGTRLVGIHSEGHAPSSPSKTVQLIRAECSAFRNGAQLELVAYVNPYRKIWKLLIGIEVSVFAIIAITSFLV